MVSPWKRFFRPFNWSIPEQMPMDRAKETMLMLILYWRRFPRSDGFLEDVSLSPSIRSSMRSLKNYPRQRKPCEKYSWLISFKSISTFHNLHPSRQIFRLIRHCLSICCRTIGCSKEQFDRVANGLLSILTHDDADYRVSAATHLGLLGQETKAIDLTLLKSFVEDPRVSFWWFQIRWPIGFRVGSRPNGMRWHIEETVRNHVGHSSERLCRGHTLLRSEPFQFSIEVFRISCGW